MEQRLVVDLNDFDAIIKPLFLAASMPNIDQMYKNRLLMTG
ncbi:hypothetical protein FHS19_000029 [Paenibacillus rhizosphaerae]|uniref:Uncharacterized protein n=1 Tax=Paenibacillus rhizosphaerae TaxID=297318 RepID=A0A839TF10_9BACL|nr:hypothetical protein [Paenibacillus rhizosphaerae]MBB3125375.1 hypothetical protein [Paenibacillus rhizosphaerae]